MIKLCMGLLFTSLSSLLLMISMVDCAPVNTGGRETIGVDDESRQRRENFDMIGMLRTYGYLPGDDNGFKSQLMSYEVVKDAIRKFQCFNGLPITGELDSATLDKMQSPRCGNPDIINRHDAGDEENTAFGAQNGPRAYTVFDTTWHKDTIYWKLTNLTEKLSSGQQIAAFQRALDIWSTVTPLTFQYSNTRPDIEVKFARGEHGDGWHLRFTGTGFRIAHAFKPGPGLGGDAHFDGDENWTINTGRRYDLTQAAAHEFGHSLGLDHSRNPDAIMAPYYTYRDNFSLHIDDVRGIQSLYGPRISKTTKSTTTTTTTTTTTPMSLTFDFCRPNFRLDAISRGPDGFVYAFRERNIYKIGDTGIDLYFPKPITDVFPGAPRKNILAVTYVPETRKTYMFKGVNVWRFTGFTLDKGYPKLYSKDEQLKPSAAITITRKGISRIFIFGTDNLWKWSTRTEKVAPGYPRSSSRYFRSTPTLPDAAHMNSKGNLFFFKNNMLMIFKRRGSKATKHALSPSLFGPVCGFIPGFPELVTLEPPPDPPAPYDRVARLTKYDEAESVDRLKTESTQDQKPTRLISSMLYE